MSYARRYSGSGRNGICVCGHSWKEHHLSCVMNPEYIEQTGETYIPEECEHYGFNEMGGKDADGNEHCHVYRDSYDSDLPRIEH